MPPNWDALKKISSSTSIYDPSLIRGSPPKDTYFSRHSSSRIVRLAHTAADQIAPQLNSNTKAYRRSSTHRQTNQKQNCNEAEPRATRPATS